MKIRLLVLSLAAIVLFLAPLQAQLENIAFHSKVIESTFKDAEFAFDGTNGELGGLALSGKLSEKEQVLVFELPVAIYLGQMKLTWLYNQNPFKINIEVSPDRQNWIKLTQEQYQVALSQKYGYSVQNIHFTDTIAAKVIKVTIPKGLEGIALTREQFSLAEIEITQSTEKFLEFTKAQFILAGDTEAFVQFSTNLETIGNIQYRKAGRTAWDTLQVVHFRKEHRWGLYGLEPGTKYEIRFVATDKIANELESNIVSFKTKSANKALNSKVKGTFVFYSPNDNITKKIADPLVRLTDNDTNYFTGLVTSGELSEKDQFLIVDLQKKQKISEVVIYWRGLSYSKDYSIWYSQDNKNWIKAAEKLSAENGYQTHSIVGDPMIAQSISINSVEARYIKLLAVKNSAHQCFYPGRTMIQIMELKIFGN